jgi:RNA methyltransferase, TrmH family
VAAGLACGQRPEAVFVVEGGVSPAELAALSSPAYTLPLTAITQRVAEKLSTLETPPPVMAVFPALLPPPLASLRAAALLAVYADRIADPGNLGTLIRAAAAFGAAALLCSPGCADPFAPKVVRASMGAVFSVPVYADQPLNDALRDLEPARAYGLVAHGGVDLAGTALTRPAVLCVGAERAGLSPEVEVLLAARLTIRLAPGAAAIESLNAGVAGAIALYEFSRRAAVPSTSGG